VIVAVADTHTAIWYHDNDRRLSQTSREFIVSAENAGQQIAVSAISLAEMVYLVEKRRIGTDLLQRLLTAMATDRAVLTHVPVDRAVIAAMPLISRNIVPDLPDRIIAATAHTLGVPLITRDGRLLLSGLATIW
jgi:PIN domain nuclease of toxin-antitoxin system